MYPNWRHTTVASSIFHPVSPINPQILSLHTSTMPSCLLPPPTNLIAPLLHPIMIDHTDWKIITVIPSTHITPANLSLVQDTSM